jgi:integrase/recombinase XerD
VKDHVAFLEYLSQDRGFSENTRLAYTADLRQFAEFLERVGVRDSASVAPEHLTSFYLELQERGYSPSTISRKLASLRSFYRFLGQSLGRDFSRLFAFSGPQVPKKKPRAADEKLLGALVELALSKGTPLGLRDGAIVSLLSWSGIHVAELVALDLDDLDLERRVVRVCRGRQMQEVWMAESTSELLKEYLVRGRPFLAVDDAEPALFLNQKGGRLTRQGLWVVLKGYASRLGVDLTPQILRHGRWRDR